MRQLIVICLTVLVINGCLDESKEPTNDFILSDGIISINDDPLISEWVNFDMHSNTRNGRTNNFVNSLDLDSAIRKTDSLGLSMYSLHIQDNEPQVLRNLVLIHHEGVWHGFIFTYNMDSTWLSTQNTDINFTDFTGHFSVIDLDGEQQYETSMEKGGSSDEKASSNGRTSGTVCYTTVVEYCVNYPPTGEVYCWDEVTTTCDIYGPLTGDFFPTEEEDCNGSCGGGGNTGDRGGTPVYQPSQSFDCADGFIKDENGICVPGCPTGQEFVNGGCQPVCPISFRRDKSGSCIRIENCVTDDEIINAIQNSFQDIWSVSGVTSDQTPMAARLENGGWITHSRGNYFFTPFPSDWERTPCWIDPPADWHSDIPTNIVGWIHSHPFFLGEDRRSICGYDKAEEKYLGGPSDDDWETLTAFANHIGNFEMKAYVIDGNKITSVDILRRLSSYNRCGY